MTDKPTANVDERPPEICFELLRLWRNGRRLDETDLHLASQAAGWLKDKGEHASHECSLIDAKKNFQEIATQIRSPTFTLNAELLASGEQALESLQSREGEDIDG